MAYSEANAVLTANQPSGPADSRQSAVDDRFDRHPWHLTIPRLRRYARERADRLTWSGVRHGPLPGGRLPEDVVHTAIEKVLTGTRAWNPSVQPDLDLFLESIVDSELSHLVESWEHRHVRPAAALPAAGDGPDGTGRDPIGEAPTPAAGPAEAAVRREEAVRQEAFAAEFIASVGDDPVLKRIVECIIADVVKPGEIAERLGIHVTEVYNRRKQLQRRLTDFYREWNATRPPDERGPGRRSWPRTR